MARCTAKVMAPRRLRASEIIADAQAGRWRTSTPDVFECARSWRHRGNHDFRTRRWIIVRELIRTAVVVVAVVAFVVVGSLDSPILH